MNKQKILILGGTGFIGRNLSNYFLDNKNYNTFYVGREYDLTQKSDVEKLFYGVNPDIVLQYAAYTTNSKDVIEQPFSHSTTNYIINALVLEAAHKVGVKHFIYPSCATMYASSTIPKKETDWTLDTIPHCYKHVAYMKTAVERMCEAYSSMGKCKYTIIRQSNVFGPFDKTDTNQAHLVPSQIIKILQAKKTLEVWGDENPRNQALRDIIYIDDVVDIVDKALQKQTTPFEIYNCGQGEGFPVSEIVKKIQKAANKNNLKITYNNSKPSIPTVTILDCSKAKQELGWEPKTSIEDGLKKTIEWYKQNIQ